ncbi:M24 family metallopeptidase [Marinicella litoralis]|uniref:Xaa-Pro dipeptidase n=1 Tax=Marinicella litoralis TaxID=644220 RepID=A0A4R6XR39_9GAMM|nr:Xaa-Pro peptidase family protein [Marinicella litoralis]TDR20454.1 Xaa-Pro dipeptidase [Marinicella litoralis]
MFFSLTTGDDMTIGVGGSDAQTELSQLKNMASKVQPIQLVEYQQRINQAMAQMVKLGWDAMYIHAGTNLSYFTGTNWHPSERMVGALLTADGVLEYIAPHFEIGTLQGFMQVQGSVHGWQEHESPYQVVQQRCKKHGIKTIGLDETLPFFMFDGLKKVSPEAVFENGQWVSQFVRSRKSEHEIQLLQTAKDMTLQVHKAAARILREGITTQEVTAFIHQAHQAVGAPKGSYFCIVLFGEDTAYPHGVKTPKTLQHNDMVLIDTGCEVEKYKSDITRSYVFGEASDRQTSIWQAEKVAQAAAFKAAQLGQACEVADIAARSYLASQGFGPDYQTPGLPHRTGHGIGMDIHEGPYLVRGDKTPLAVGMCFSNEPMLCVPGEFGVRLEDHFYMTADGPKWFTEPSHSIDDPFGQAV